MKQKIGVLNHSFNIGNHLFEISIMQDLKKVFGETAEIIPVEGRHFYSDFLLSAKKKNYLDYGIFANLDYFVLSGPIFQHKTLKANFSKLFSNMKRNKTKFIYLSAGSSEYTLGEIEEVRKFLEEFPPYAISTRDSFTFDAYNDLAEYSHDGICSAFFSSFHFKGYNTTELGKYIILNFEEADEPSLDLFLQRKKFKLNQSLINRFSKKPNKKEVIRNYFKKYDNRYKDYTLIRTLHNFQPSLMKPFLNRPNQFVSVNPYSYLNLYSKAELVLARRVHACVPALSYGNPAMLFNNTKRSKLFERVGLGNITSEVVTLDIKYLDKEYKKFIEFINKIKNNIIK